MSLCAFEQSYYSVKVPLDMFWVVHTLRMKDTDAFMLTNSALMAESCEGCPRQGPEAFKIGPTVVPRTTPYDAVVVLGL
jgi:hypothetical protein